MSVQNLALSRGTLDRVAHRRTDSAWLARAWADPASLVLPVVDGQVPVEHSEAQASLRLLPAVEAPEGERYLLGVDDGRAYFAVQADKLPAGAQSAGLRDVGALLDDRDAGLVVHAVALANWHSTHRHCSRCGAATEARDAGHVRRCPRDGSDHYPRTDPAVIMTIVDDADRVLLGRQASWPERRFSALAGFVEPGESLEQAVRREVAEEAGVRVGEVRYLGSQPWPFPSSLMVAFTGRAATTALEVDGRELAEAAWFERSEVMPALAEERLHLPPPVSIARRMIEHWYGGPL